MAARTRKVPFIRRPHACRRSLAANPGDFSVNTLKGAIAVPTENR